METEPSTEQLSAYLDHELPGREHQELAEHLAGCETCRRRIQSLESTVNAIQSLPKEMPPRVFTIPAQRQQPTARRSWLPFAWAGAGALAAVLIVAALVVPRPGGGAAGTARGPLNAYAPAMGAPDQKAAPNAVTVTDSSNPARRLTLSTDSSSYSRPGTLNVRVSAAGGSLTSTNLSVHVLPASGGTGFEVPLQVAAGGSSATGSYAVGALPAGTYFVAAKWIPVAGSTLEGSVPIAIR